MTRFGDMFLSIRNGLNVKQSSDLGGLPITRIETTSSGAIDCHRVGYAGIESIDSKWLLCRDDILFSHINSPQHVGRVAIYQGQPKSLVHGMNLLCLRPDPTMIDAKYTLHLIRSQSFKSHIGPFINKAVNQASISIANLSSVEVDVPPLKEQRRIAAILDYADALRAKRRQVLAHIDTLTQSIFENMFSDVWANTFGLDVASVGDIADRVTDGEHKTPRRSESGVPLLSARSVRDGWIDFDNTDFVDESEYALLSRRIEPRPGDVLISCSGSIGRVAQVRDRDRFAMVRSAALVRPGPAVHPTFLEHALAGPKSKATMVAQANSSAQANLFQNQIKRLPILVPPLEQQLRFAERAQRINGQRSDMQRALAGDDELFASLQARAFRGEL